MEYVSLGDTGVKVSRLCLGMMTYGSPAWRDWVLPEAEGCRFVRQALDHGINFFDSADMYSRGASEEILGRAIKQSVSRDQVVVATKVYFPMGDGPNDRGLSRKHIFDAIDASLSRLGFDYVDLYQIHRYDPETPLEETLNALNDLVQAGKVRYLGASSMYAWQFARALHTADRHGWARFATMQNHYNLVYREEEREMLPLCRAEGVGVIPWSPLARGFLAGTRKSEAEAWGTTNRAKTDDFARRLYFGQGDFDIVERVKELARRRDATPAQIALAWLVQQPGIAAPIVGVSKSEQLDQLVAALDITLDDDECALLEDLYIPHPVLGHA